MEVGWQQDWIPIKAPSWLQIRRLVDSILLWFVMLIIKWTISRIALKLNLQEILCISSTCETIIITSCDEQKKVNWTQAFHSLCGDRWGNTISVLKYLPPWFLSSHQPKLVISSSSNICLVFSCGNILKKRISLNIGKMKKEETAGREIGGRKEGLRRSHLVFHVFKHLKKCFYSLETPFFLTFINLNFLSTVSVMVLVSSLHELWVFINLVYDKL